MTARMVRTLAMGCLACAFATAQMPELVEEIREVNLTPIRVPGIARPMTVVEFEAPSLDRRMKYLILLPEGYEDSDRRYPVLYMLHGFSQNYTVFPRMGIPEHTADKDLIVVMPDAGNSWYVNWARSEDGKVNNWADFIVYDLIESVDAVWRTIPRRAGRAISGVSMGGYGALMLGLRRPDLFISVASHSGTLNYARAARLRIEAGAAPQRVVAPLPVQDDRDEGVPPLIAIEGFTRQHERYPEGYPFLTAQDCRVFDPFELVEMLPPERLPHLYIDCATGDSLLEDAQQFMRLLLDLGVPVTYAQSPGGHGVRYWTRETAQSIAVQYSIMLSALAGATGDLIPVRQRRDTATEGGNGSSEPAHDHGQMRKNGAP